VNNVHAVSGTTETAHLREENDPTVTGQHTCHVNENDFHRHYEQVYPVLTSLGLTRGGEWAFSSTASCFTFLRGPCAAVSLWCEAPCWKLALVDLRTQQGGQGFHSFRLQMRQSTLTRDLLRF
jgi:hypothetical protein